MTGFKPANRIVVALRLVGWESLYNGELSDCSETRIYSAILTLARVFTLRHKALQLKEQPITGAGYYLSPACFGPRAALLRPTSRRAFEVR